jgi:uncharacterized protein YgbK (DUF1537 family)
MTLDQVRAGPIQTRSAIQQLLSDGVELVIVDISAQDDLKQLCLSLSESNLQVLWVGSTGLAEFIPLALEVAPLSSSLSRNHLPDPRPALALVGSASETTRTQLRYAETNNGLNIIHLDPAQMIQNGRSSIAEIEQALSHVRAVLDAGHDAALVVRASREEIAATQQLGASINLSAAQVAQRIVEALAQAGGRLVREGRISGIVATGGDTANALCNALGAQGLEILGEVEAGIPVMRLLGEQSLLLVTKAGGFGSPAAIQDALLKVKQYA